MATASRIRLAAIIVIGSLAPKPYGLLAIRRVAPKASGKPIAIPKKTTLSVSRNHAEHRGLACAQCQGSLDELELSIADAAKVLGVSRQGLNNVVSGRASVSAEMAFRLAKAFGSTPDFWMRLQTNYDLAQIRLREHEIDVKRYRRAS